MKKNHIFAIKKNYTKMNKARLLGEFKKEKKKWNSLPRKSSFGGLAVSGRLNSIQQLMQRRGYVFESFYTQINMFD